VKKAFKIINVLLPLAIPKVYSYKVEKAYWDSVQFGVRVEVPLRNKLLSGIVIEETDENPHSLHKLRYIVSVIDKIPIITQEQYKLWQWISEYYMCTIGEVMNVALPSGLKLSSETKLIVRSHIDDFEGELSDKEYMLAEAVSIQHELTIAQVQQILDQKTVFPYIKSLMDKGIVLVKEELKEGFRAKKERFIKITDSFQGDKMTKALDLCVRSTKQTRALLSYAQLSQKNTWVSSKKIRNHAVVDSAVFNALAKKGIIKIEDKEVSRLSNELISYSKPPPLNEHQEVALKEIQSLYATNNKVLLFGVTGSGKTRIYIELIKECIEKGQQVLYLLPEIALTTQIVDRLMTIFGNDIGVYHSKMSNNQRVEVWNAAMTGKALILGARSSIFLPFKNLGLIIIDEEHDPSYKQSDPAPRYNARDTSIFLSNMFKCKVLLGTATPSLETYINTKKGKYGLVKLMERHGQSQLPDIQVVDLREQYKKGLMTSIFSKDMKDAINLALSRKEQVLIFQNRRGYSPTLQCMTCDFHAECPNCDVSLTVHEFSKELKCHYCSYRHKLPHHCPQCGSDKLDKLGFGTERIEAEIKNVFPKTKVARLDFDTAKTRNAYTRILTSFKDHEVDILVGTQMVTKGLDFDNISIVGILAADKILYFPDFKANERAFQLFTQVAGRAGRREKKGQVIIQTYNPTHPVITETRNNDHNTFYKRETEERQRFFYPPYFRLINITIKHKDAKIALEVAQALALRLRTKIGNRVIGPSIPGIARLRGLYIQNILIKMEKKSQVIKTIKTLIKDQISDLRQAGLSKNVRFILDIDP